MKTLITLLLLLSLATLAQTRIIPFSTNPTVAGGGGGGGIPTIVYTDSVTNYSWYVLGDSALVTVYHWASIQANDLILILLSDEDGVPNWSVGSNVSESGWEIFFTGGANNTIGIGGFYKVATGSEADSFYVTSPKGALAGYEQIGYYVVIRGADTTTPLDSVGVVIYQADNQDSCAVTQILTQANNCLVIAFATSDGSDAGYWGGQVIDGTAGWTMWSWAAPRENSNALGCMFAYKEQASIGETGYCDFKMTSFASRWGGIMFSVKGAE